MAISSTQQLGQKISETNNRVDNLEQNISPNEDAAIDTLTFSEDLTVGGTVTLNKLTYASNSFIIDHPVLGDIDSSTLHIDGGYKTLTPFEGTGASFPIQFATQETLLIKTL